MKPAKFRIWWSPVGFPNGETVIDALSLMEAKAEALERMRRFSMIGAYGADPIPETTP